MTEKEPQRLFDDPELSEALREDLRIAASDAGVEYDPSQGLARLSSAIAPGAGTVATATGASTKSIVVAIAVGIGAIGIGGLLYRTKPPPPEAPPVVASAPPTEATRAPPTPIPTAELSVNDLPREAPSASARVEAPAPSSLSPEERLRAEMKQLAEVRSAVGSAPARALDLANRGHRDFKGGVFYQEREALAISALRALGRSGEANTRAKAFLASFPKGPYAERVRKEAGIAAP